MRNVGRAVWTGAKRLAALYPGLSARVRLFGLLILLIPLFAGLQRLVADAEASAEIRLTSREVPVLVPVERIVERVVERIIYQPVPADAAPSPPALPGPRP
jgi:hypothetical protein